MDKLRDCQARLEKPVGYKLAVIDDFWHAALK